MSDCVCFLLFFFFYDFIIFSQFFFKKSLYIYIYIYIFETGHLSESKENALHFFPPICLQWLSSKGELILN